jgi:hypothetical protein
MSARQGAELVFDDRIEGFDLRRKAGVCAQLFFLSPPITRREKLWLG